MRIVVGVMACLGAGALTSALADPPTDTQGDKPAATAAAPAASPAPASASQAASSDAAAARAAAAKAQLDRDTRHFLAEGYKPEMHRGEQIYCRKENVLGSRVTAMKDCGTIEQLRVREERTNENAHEGH
jgi:hypothetical protein